MLWKVIILTPELCRLSDKAQADCMRFIQ